MKTSTFLKSILMMVTILLFAVGCSKDDDRDIVVDKATKVTVTLQDSDGKASSGWIVYAFSETSATVHGVQEPMFAAAQAATNEQGVAVFSNLTDRGFITKNEEVFHFVVYYKIGERSFYKDTPLTLKKGRETSLTIKL